MYTAFNYVAGFTTNPDGDCLGFRMFMEALPTLYPEIQSFNYISWDKVTADWIADHSPLDGRTILASHSYGGAGTKRALDKLGNRCKIDLAIWMDPVPRFMWGQFRIPFMRWKMPDNVVRGIQFYQHNFPPTGFPFAVDNRLTSLDVTDWQAGLHHSDIPGSTMVQHAILKEMAKIMVEKPNPID